jgi:PAS domain S-box-containing protein
MTNTLSINEVLHPETISPEKNQQRINDLHVHQTVLERSYEQSYQAKDNAGTPTCDPIDLFELAPIGYLLINTNGQISKANSAAATLLGVKQIDLPNKPVTGFILPEDQDIYLLNCKQLLTADTFMACELRMVHGSGAPFWAHLSAAPMQKLPLSEIQTTDFTFSFCVTFSNISEQKHAQAELQKKNDEIEQLLYTIAHDLRSPLLTVETFMDYIKSDMTGSNRAQFAQDMHYIGCAVDKMKLLLNELLELSRIVRSEAHLTKVSLNKVMTDVLGSFDNVIRERKITLQLPDSDLTLFVDRPRLCHILQNLVENAIKFSRNDCIPTIELGVKQLGKEIAFFVKDNGIGIDHQDRIKIFALFEKVNPKIGGHGLGLSIIQRIVEKCGGRIWVESEGTNKGSCFLFILPHVLIQNT